MMYVCLKAKENQVGAGCSWGKNTIPLPRADLAPPRKDKEVKERVLCRVVGGPYAGSGEWV